MCVCKDSAAPAAHGTRTQARRGATPETEIRRVTDTTSHGPQAAGRHSTQTSISSPGLCGRPKGGGGGSSRFFFGIRAGGRVGGVG